jgi:hypothetical protein
LASSFYGKEGKGRGSVRLIRMIGSRIGRLG